MSRGQLKQKLLAKGVERDIAERAVEDGCDGDETEQIKVLLAKRHYDSENCDQKEFARIYQYILRRGFRSSDILKCMKA